LVPILFDFTKPAGRNITETVSILAHLARFVIADITDARSIPQELQHIVPNNPSLPVQPIILASQHQYGMFADLLDYPWVLAPFAYENADALLGGLRQNVVVPALSKAQDIEERRERLEQSLGR
jgi:hypothetical protein